MNILGKVRRLYHRDRLSISEIERRTGLTRKTIRNWLKAPEGTEPKYPRQIGESKIAHSHNGEFSHNMCLSANTVANHKQCSFYLMSAPFEFRCQFRDNPISHKIGVRLPWEERSIRFFRFYRPRGKPKYCG